MSALRNTHFRYVPSCMTYSGTLVLIHDFQGTFLIYALQQTVYTLLLPAKQTKQELKHMAKGIQGLATP